MGHLDLGNLRFLLPIPHCQHVIVTVINNTQVLARVLKEGQTKREPWWDAEFLPCFLVTNIPPVAAAPRRILTALEKAREPTPRSNVPVPITCRVDRETLSQIRTCGCSAWDHQRFMSEDTDNWNLQLQFSAIYVTLHMCFLFPPFTEDKNEDIDQFFSVLTRPSLSTPAICPVAIRILSGWMAKLANRQRQHRPANRKAAQQSCDSHHLTQSVCPR